MRGKNHGSFNICLNDISFKKTKLIILLSLKTYRGALYDKETAQILKIPQLTFTRFVAAIGIVAFHYGKNVPPFNLPVIQSTIQHAYIGVSYFFILSGFIMMIAYSSKERIDFWNFMKRRISRIYPVFFLAIIILLAYHVVFGSKLKIIELILNVTLSQSWVPGYALSFNSPSWSLAVEMFFYSIFPLAYNLFFKHFSLAQIAIPIIAFYITSQIAAQFLIHPTWYSGYPSPSHDLAYYFPAVHLNEFFIGNLCGVYFLNHMKSRNYDLAILLLLIALIAILNTELNVNIHNGLMAVVFAPLILCISANSGLLTKVSKHKALILLGEISYALYILQQPIHVWVSALMGFLNVNDSIFVFYFYLAVLILSATLSYRLVEKPLRKALNSFSWD